MNILVVGPHPDDQELGMGGTIARLASQGHSVLLLDLTDGSPTPRGDAPTRLREAEAALEALQPTADKPRLRRVNLGLPNRKVEHTLDARARVAGVIRAHQANIIFVPRPLDAHPDHRAGTRIVEDARFDAKLSKFEPPVPPGFAAIGPPLYARWLFHYDASHLRGVHAPDFCIDITGFEQAKLAAIRAYKSQFGPWDDATPIAPGDPKAAPLAGALVGEDWQERTLAHARVWGAAIGVRYAEAFWSPEPLGLTSLAALV